MQLLDGDLRRADRLQALLGVPGRAARIEHTGDHPLDVEPSLGDLRHDEVRVVAVGGGDEHVRLLDAGLDQRVDLQGRPDREAASRFLPGTPELDIEALKEINLKVGQSTIKMTPGSIEITSPTITIQSQALTEVKSDGMLVVKAPMVNIN